VGALAGVGGSGQNTAMERTATIRQAVILAGGLGTRLGALTAETAKPVLEVGGRPFLFWPMRELQRFGVERFLVLTGHGAATAEAAVRSAAADLPRPAEIAFVREPAPLGTGGALLHAAPSLDERFLLLNGDTLFDCNLAVLLAAAAAQPASVEGHMLLRAVADVSRYGVATTDGPAVTGFAARAEGGPGLINAGIYVLDRRVLPRLGAGGSLERDVLPGLAEAGLLHGTVADGWFIDIGTPEDLARARAELPGRLRRRALFLDRDGVLNVDHGYVGSRERWEWTPRAREAVALATGRGWHVFIATNQSGIARGLYDEAAVFALHAWVADELRAAGGTLDDWRHCPFHPEAALPRWRRVSDWRKPGPGMLLDLLRAWELDPADCVMLGDQPSDLEAAAAAGIAGHRYAGGPLDAVVAALLDAVPAG
jgi:D-glycero-D-manno-heptose 1,7-bisphosphate phosphatase